MGKKEKNNRGFSSIELALVIVIVVLIGMAGWLLYQNHQKSSISSTTSTQVTASNKSAALTNDQIFQEVSSQLNVPRNSLVFFRIFGQNKVQYSSTASGNTYAYKVSGTWKIAASNVQSVLLCSSLNSVPEQYRPPCGDGDSTSSTVKYANSDGTATNYPISKAVSYIGQ